ncbi:MAG: hydroxymethylglutaryl-CoA reductase, degradative [archaeon]
MPVKNSELPGFYKLSIEERLKILSKLANLDENEVNQLKGNPLRLEIADKMIENVIGTFQVPLGIATSFKINGKDYLVPMAIEEPSVIAAASNAAKIARKAGGFKAKSDEPIMIGQIQILDIPNVENAKKEIFENLKEIKRICDEKHTNLVNAGGGFKDLFLYELNTEIGKMLIVNLLVDVRDAMGANVINSMCETLAPFLEKITGGTVRLRILSNLAVYRKVKAEAIFSKEAIEESFKGEISGEEAIENILQAYYFAKNDKFRATTHNKGIMNGIDAVALATGNDFRALEAGAHAFASLKQGYGPLTEYYKNDNGDLVGRIEIPLAFGIVGGITKSHPLVKINLKILGVKSAQELAEVAACVGLANNFASLRALATEGIQKGHMKLHAKNIAMSVGATGQEVEEIVEKMVEEKNISMSRAKEILEEIRKSKI